MTTGDIFIMLSALILGTQLCRFIPALLPKNLTSATLLQKLNKMLPLVIMLLLVLSSLSIPTSREGIPLLFAQLLALTSVIGSYIWLKNTFLSVSIGILSINLFLALFG